MRCRIAGLRFEAFLDDDIMRGVHVDEDETVAVLRQDVDAVQLRQREAEWVFDRWCVGAFSVAATALSPAGCGCRFLRRKEILRCSFGNTKVERSGSR